MIAVVRVKGGFKTKHKFNDTLRKLRLNKKHHCVILPDNPANNGMIKKVRHMITWGEIDKDTLKKLITKRGRQPGNKKIKLTNKKLDSMIKTLMSGKKTLADYDIKPVFRLSPPKKGWDKGTVKLEYPRGALGPRGKDINKLLKKMI
ncbi:50S ribosomal protein L30 [archaeon]|nr:50S ribosomal protein L30 [archaeon]